MQKHFITASKPPPVLCPECKVPFKRQQELRRHILSLHLPYWIYCPYPGCSWRGHRKEDFQSHLDHQKCGPKPERRQYEIYVTGLVLDWIIEGASVERAARYALDFVAERALELGKAEEWRDLWGARSRGRGALRRRVGY
jgi:Zinc finger, C2H2 type